MFFVEDTEHKTAEVCLYLPILVKLCPMQREFAPTHDIKGFDQRYIIKRRLKNEVETLNDMGSPRTGFAQAIVTHFDDLGIDWDAPRNLAQINAIVPSLYGAFNIAQFITKGKFFSDTEIETPELSWTAISDVLADPDAKDIFYEKMWQLPVSFAPQRVVPVYHTVRHLFGDQSLAMVDLGAGPGYTLPGLNTFGATANEVVYAPMRPQTVFNNGDLVITCGVSVDKLPRDEAILLAKANSHDARRELMDKFLNEIDESTFPFVVADLSETDASYPKIADELMKKGRNHANVILSSFVRYQLGPDETAQNEFRSLVAMLTTEGGIWIDIGDEMLNNRDHFTYNVNVYQKHKDRMVLTGVPFVIDEMGTILETNYNFFKSPHNLSEPGGIRTNFRS